MASTTGTVRQPVRSAAAVRPRRPPLWVSAVVVVGALGVISLSYSALFDPQTMLGHGQQVTAAARVWAHYAAAYDAALAIALIAFLAARAYQVLAGVLLQAAIAETLLAVVGYTAHRPEQIAADLLLIAAFVFAAVRLSRYPSHDSAR